MDDDPSPEVLWNHLLRSGGYSIGYFSITLSEDQVRVYHYRTGEVTRFPKDDSFVEMERLCQERGYDLSYLLQNYYPKTYHKPSSPKRSDVR